MSFRMIPTNGRIQTVMGWETMLMLFLTMLQNGMTRTEME